MSRIFEVLKVSTRLGLTSFGGPIAHLGYFHDEYVKRRKWLDEKSYADLVALCQFLPGPASSQVGIAIGIERAGLLGGLMAWIGFTLPSAIALMIFAFVLKGLNIQQAGWLHGLMIVAVAVVAQAVWGMASKLATGRVRGAIAILSATCHTFNSVLTCPSAHHHPIRIDWMGVDQSGFDKRHQSDANSNQSKDRYCFSCSIFYVSNPSSSF